MSEDYKKGYRDGFLDGFKAAKDNPYMTQPAVPKPYAHVPPSYLTTPPWRGCNVCKLPSTELIGYCCARSDCPTRITS